MSRQLGFAIIFFAVACNARVYADPLSAYLEKVRGNVTENGAAGMAIRLKTGDVVPPGRTVNVGRLSVAVYGIGQEFMLKEDPATTMTFSGISATRESQGGPGWNVEIRLQTGSLYSAMRNPRNEALNYEITTSRIEAYTHRAVFKVVHSFSTSTVLVQDGEVEVLYCNHSKKVIVKAGEVFTVTDCDGYLGWQTDQESWDMTLFAALIGSGFGNSEIAMLGTPLGVLGPALPPGLPIKRPVGAPPPVTPTVPPSLPIISP